MKEYRLYCGRKLVEKFSKLEEAMFTAISECLDSGLNIYYSDQMNFSDILSDLHYSYSECNNQCVRRSIARSIKTIYKAQRMEQKYSRVIVNEDAGIVRCYNELKTLSRANQILKDVNTSYRIKAY